MCHKFHVILPVLLLASAVQPVYRFGAFIESAHADSLDAQNFNGTDNDDSGKPADDPPEPSWPIELIGLFPSWIGSCEQTFGSGVGGWPQFLAYSEPLLFRRHKAPRVFRFANLIRSELGAGALIVVVAHPIHTHAPPPPH